MLRSALFAGATFLAFLLLAAAPARAERLGGAFRGPGDDPPPARVRDDRIWWCWFEHEKEALLASRLSEPRPGTPVPDEQREGPVFEVLVASLTSESSWVRDAAVLALGKLGLEKGVEPICGRLRDPDPDVREDALLALGLTRRANARPPLLAALGEEDPGMKSFAALGLALLGNRDEALVARLVDEFRTLCAPEATRQQKEAAACVAIALGTLGGERVVPTLADAADRPRGDPVPPLVGPALGRIGGARAEETLLRMARGKEPAVGAAACLALGGRSDSRAVALLLRSLHHADRMTKLFSLISLGRIGRTLEATGDRRRGTILRELVERATVPEKDKVDATYAALALGIAGDHGADEFFAEYLGEENRTKFAPETHAAMAMAAGFLGNRNVVPDLRQIAVRGRVEDEYRGYAAFALGLLGDRDSKDAILAAMGREPNRVEFLRSGCWAIALLGGPEDVPALLGLLRRDERAVHHVRGAAAIAIGRVGDASTVGPLLKIASEDPDTSNRAFAIAALGWLVDEDPVPRIPLLFAGTDPRHQPDAVRQALRNL